MLLLLLLFLLLVPAALDVELVLLLGVRSLIAAVAVTVTVSVPPDICLCRSMIVLVTLTLGTLELTEEMESEVFAASALIRMQREEGNINRSFKRPSWNRQIQNSKARLTMGDIDRKRETDRTELR